jgi:transposase-like protein
MAERHVSAGHSTVYLWAIRLLRMLEGAFRIRKRSVRKNWRMDEAYISVKR